MLPSFFATTLKRKLLSSAIFGVASGAFFFCFFGLLSGDGTLMDELRYYLAPIVLPAVIVAFLVTPGEDKYLEDCSLGKALLAGIGITALAYLASYIVFFLPEVIVYYRPTTINALPFALMDFVYSVYSAFGVAMLGAIITFPVALPLGMLGGLLYRFLARRTLNAS